MTLNYEEMNKQQMISGTEQTLSAFQTLFTSIDVDKINTVPFEGSWSAAQLARHMILANGGFIQLIHGPVKDTERDPEEGIIKLKESFLNFDTKMKSPEFIIPEDIVYNKAILAEQLHTIHLAVTELDPGLDLFKTCTAFELPQVGFITRIEALAFINYHTQRHQHQLKKIIDIISQS